MLLRTKRKYQTFKKALITPQKIIKWATKSRVVIYDNRVKHYFANGHFLHSINLRHKKLEQAILNRNKRDKIVLIGYEERTNAALASWARNQGYKKVYLVNGGANNIDKTFLVKSIK